MMRGKKILLTNFSHAIESESLCLRPETENQLSRYIVDNQPDRLLARGSGLSYNDSCLNKDGLVIDTKRFNHLIKFDETSGIVECQGAVTFKDLFLLHPEFIPPVIPGTVYATIAGGLAHDVHGKNNHREGSLGDHISWFELDLGGKSIRCSREQHSELFYATIAGLGLTGIITRIALRLKKASRFVQVEHKPYESIQALTENMSTYGLNYDYQVAWIDLLNPIPRSILSLANHCEPFPYKEEQVHTTPKFPFRMIRQWNMKLFNKMYFSSMKSNTQLSLEQFNNPLDKINHWNRLYGPKGLMQFQAVFEQEKAVETIEQLVQIIRNNKAIPTLAVLKLFIRSGEGLLSFCKPGFTIAIDFINNSNSKKAITAMNQFITEINGRVYLAKDLLLTTEQFQKMYPNHQQFFQLLSNYQSTMHSDLSTRLGITQ